MYLIIEKYRGDIYAYFEDRSHFKQTQNHRGGLRRLNGKCLDDECDLKDFPDNSYVVIPVLGKNSWVGMRRAAKLGKRSV